VQFLGPRESGGGPEGPGEPGESGEDGSRDALETADASPEAS